MLAVVTFVDSLDLSSRDEHNISPSAVSLIAVADATMRGIRLSF